MVRVTTKRWRGKGLQAEGTAHAKAPRWEPVQHVWGAVEGPCAQVVEQRIMGKWVKTKEEKDAATGKAADRMTQAVSLNPDFATDQLGTLEKSLPFPEAQFPYLQNGNNQRNHLIALFF